MSVIENEWKVLVKHERKEGRACTLESRRRYLR